MAEARGAYWDARLETIPRDELRQVQRAWLEWQLRRCWDGAPFYRARLEAAGIDPDDGVSFEQLAPLAPLTPAELVAEQAAHPPFGRLAVASPAAWRQVFPIGTDPRQRWRSVWTEADSYNVAAHAARLLWQCGVRPGDRVVSGFAPESASAAALRGGVTRLEAVLVVPPLGWLPARLDAFAPAALVAPALALSGSAAARASSASARPSCIGLLAGLGGLADPGARSALEAALCLRVFDCYGLQPAPPSEPLGLPIAAECEVRAGLHLVEDQYLVEVLDPDSGVPLADGDEGVLVVTTLTREATPLVRLWTGDRGRLDPSPCPCGRTTARLVGGVRPHAAPGAA